MISKYKILRIIVGTSLIFGIAITGCAGKGSVPTAKMANAEKAIADARNSNAIVSAPLDLRLSEDKLVKAKDAVTAEEYEKAGRLADEAIIDADVARAKARAAKAKKISSEARETVDSLRKEIERTQP